MTRMEWKERYDADAEPYATPEIIKKWYADGGVHSVTWGDGVQDLYQNKTPSQPETSNQRLSVGAIAGISIGTVAGIIALIISIFLFIRKYQRKQTEKHHELETRLDRSLSTWTSATTTLQPVEMYSAPPELGGDTQRIAMRDSLQVPGQIPADRRTELHGDERLEMVG
ncbi:unnamed protein product [Clonostachys rhizophaga]|uniref:Uncharacterized protein n=1 Tax=Clonostachys rhizophaga TaxID=160324 RepID=A0A9N9YH14_9HYPO|nr:unnamed protein product [Clonostachys rhizophaga]